MQGYEQFLETKLAMPQHSGIQATIMPDRLFPFQKQITEWACERGRAALFLDTGLGKTACQLTWAANIAAQKGDVLILAPLAVAQQTVAEGALMDIPVTLCRTGSDVQPGINITNYERIHHFNTNHVVGIVLDESSCLKAHDGKTRNALIERFINTPYRLCCTATPAPNDYMELGNHAEFLGILTRSEMLATYFTHDGGNTSHWRLKGHGQEHFWRWIASWAVALTHPKYLGDMTPGYDLPPLERHMHQLALDVAHEGLTLFPMEARTLQEQRAAKRAGLRTRIDAVISLIQSENHSWREDDRGRKEAAPKALHATVDSSTQGSDTAISRNYQRQEEREKERTLCDERRAQREEETRSQNVSTRESTTEETTTPEAIRNNAGRIYGDADTAGQSMRDMRLLGHGNEELFSASGPLPRDKQSERALVSELQSSIGKIQRQHRDSPSSDRLFAQESWVIWCELNDEQTALEKIFKEDAISIYGTLDIDEKERRLLSWLKGEKPILICKASICGFGVNMQHCARMAFVGINNSFEMLYQAIRRCWRFGQARPVHAHFFYTDIETAIVRNLARKEQEADTMHAAMTQAVLSQLHWQQMRTAYVPDNAMTIPSWLYANIETPDHQGERYATSY